MLIRGQLQLARLPSSVLSPSPWQTTSGLVLKWKQQQFSTIIIRSAHTWTHIYLSDRPSWEPCCPILHCTDDDPSSSSSPASDPHSAFSPLTFLEGESALLDGWQEATLPSQWAMLQAMDLPWILTLGGNPEQNRWDSHSLPEKHSLSKADDKCNKQMTIYGITRWTFN